MRDKQIWVDGKPTNIEIRDKPIPEAELESLGPVGSIIFLVIYIWFDWTHNWMITRLFGVLLGIYF